jgi:hypothetical protein
MDDIEGCIAMGRYTGEYKNKRAVLDSGNTIDKFHKLLNGKDLLLSIFDFTNL